MRKTVLASLVVSTLLLALPLYAQKLWEKKDYTRWSKSECQKLLRDSPWAWSFTIGTVIFQPVGEESAAPGREMTPQIIYQAQLWSARPIRQALIRQSQMRPEHQKLAQEQRQAVEEKQAKFVETEFPDTVLVQVSYSANPQPYDQQLARHWQSQPPEELKHSIYLIGGRGKVLPLQVNVTPGAGREIQLVFPRTLGGEPLIHSGDKTLGLEFPHPAIELLPAERVYIEFDVKKMVVNDALVY